MRRIVKAYLVSFRIRNFCFHVYKTAASILAAKSNRPDADASHRVCICLAARRSAEYAEEILQMREQSMKLCGVILFFIVCVFAIFLAPQRVWPVDIASADTGSAEIDFYLIPLLEAAFSGDAYWRPDWPQDIPPDGFSLQRKNEVPEEIELFNNANKFIIKRDSEGRLVEFPFFMAEGYIKVKAVYSDTGALQTMNASLSSGLVPVELQAAETEEKIWNIEFPADFIPYGDYSPGGSFPPAKIGRGGSVFYVFFFESPDFFTATWYDSEGNFLSFCKALVDRNKPASSCTWRIRSLQIHGLVSPRFEDYFFDSDGNITEVRLSEKSFQAIYQNGRPRYWRYQDGLQYELHWNTQGILTSIKTVDTEYRYEYERDTSGNWIKRLETAYRTQSDLLIPTPSYSRWTWNRRIQFFETGIGKTPSAEY
jgi:hypothetical protein